MEKTLETLEVYLVAETFSDKIWEIVMKWNRIAQYTVGEQVIRSSDSIGANIAEGYGRYFFKEKIKFLLYSRGSLLETKSWLRKMKNRKLITQKQFDELHTELADAHKKLNGFIKYISKGKKVPTLKELENE